MPLWLPESFFAQDTVTVARQLLGCTLHWNGCAGIVSETEAYLPSGDPAAHAFAGRTPRTQVLFGPPGRAYVYQIYGLHLCLNVVAEPEGVPGCVLLRAVWPTLGLAEMQQRRQPALPAKPAPSNSSHPRPNLCQGPGRLTQAFGFSLSDTGQRLTFAASPLPPATSVQVTPRIGITKAADWPLRFFLAPDPGKVEV